jgi:hypothetical protein
MGGVISKDKKRKSKKLNNNFHIKDNDNNYLSTRRISSESSLSYSSSKSMNSFVQCNELIKTYGNRKYINGENVRDIFPIDKDELERLELTHFWSKELWNEEAFLLPVDEVFHRNAKVLDIG